MQIIIDELINYQGQPATRPIAGWTLPDTAESLEVSFTQLATPDAVKVATYRLRIYRDGQDG